MRLAIQGVRPVTWTLALYFILVAADIAAVGNVGSLLKILALFPVAFAVLDFRRLRVRFDAAAILPLVFWLIALCSCFYSVDTGMTIKYLVTLSLNLALVLVLGVMETYSQQELQILMKALLIGSWLTVILLVLFSDFSEGGRLTLKLGSEAQDENVINGYLLYAFSYHIYSFFHKKGVKHLALASVLIIVGFYTGSRGAMLAYVAIFLVAWFHTMRDGSRILRNLGKLILVLGALLIVYQLVKAILPREVLMRFSLSYLMEKGSIGRTKIWKYLWDCYQEDTLFRQIFGHGYGTTVIINELNHRVAHNLYLDNLITLGLVGMAAQIAMQGSCIWKAVRSQQYVLMYTYLGFVVLCMSLSMTSFKPMWNIMMMILIMAYHPEERAESENPACTTDNEISEN